MPEIIMPRLSDTMEDGVVSSWLKQVGDQVSRGDIVAEIETDKALMELEAYDDGVLEQILFEEGARVPIGVPIALVGDGSATLADTPAPSATAAAQPATTEAAAPTPVGTPVPAAESAPGDRKVKSSPLARKIARELGIDIAAVVGTGPGGRVTRLDVESFTAADSSATQGSVAASAVSAPAPSASPDATTTPASGDYDEVALTAIQRVSAQRLTESKQQAPHIYLTSAIDVTALLEFRAQINATLAHTGAGKVSVNDLLVKAVALTLRSNPQVNASFAGETLRRHHGVHVGIAVATPAGLLVPVIRDADRKAVSAIATESRDKAERARDRKLGTHEMTGGTFTISNLGMFDIEHFTAVINPPEAAILAVGAATDELQLHDGNVVSRKILRVTLSADHRAIDGAIAAQFLKELKTLLQQPMLIVV
ncbi:dihydrolipoamide acetyltransferase family protein [Nocardia callitridis]|uniref:Dihydrolipoamide acetyltransferase component of pyruvate dehydrogenase complex n=1 Tax=Nocardia callitridis TaxID=648753 RepID=A0ABP9KPV2_9NOCA